MGRTSAISRSVVVLSSPPPIPICVPLVSSRGCAGVPTVLDQKNRAGESCEQNTHIRS